MNEIGSRQRQLPAPRHAVWEALIDPHRRGAREWLVLLEDEVQPTVLVAEEPTRLVWSSLWPSRPRDQVHLDLGADPADPSGGTALRWTLLTPAEVPDASKAGHQRKRLNHLFFADLRFSFGQ